jgi:hypothetical protein
MHTNHSPFMMFWQALNKQCRLNGYPEPTFGPAQRAWRNAVEQASHEAFAAAWKDAA